MPESKPREEIDTLSDETLAQFLDWATKAEEFLPLNDGARSVIDLIIGEQILRNQYFSI